MRSNKKNSEPAKGLEPSTCCLQDNRSTKLSYAGVCGDEGNRTLVTLCARQSADPTLTHPQNYISFKPYISRTFCLILPTTKILTIAVKNINVVQIRQSTLIQANLMCETKLSE